MPLHHTFYHCEFIKSVILHFTGKLRDQVENMNVASLNLRLLVTVLSFTASMSEGVFASQTGLEDDDTVPLLRSHENDISRSFRVEIEALKFVFQNYEPLTLEKISRLRFVYQNPFNKLRGQVLDKKLGYNNDLNISSQTQADYETLLEYLCD